MLAVEAEYSAMAQVDFGDHNPFVHKTVDAFLREMRKRTRMKFIVAGTVSAAMVGLFALVMSALG